MIFQKPNRRMEYRQLVHLVRADLTTHGSNELREQVALPHQYPLAVQKVTQSFLTAVSCGFAAAD